MPPASSTSGGAHGVLSHAMSLVSETRFDLGVPARQSVPAFSPRHAAATPCLQSELSSRDERADLVGRLAVSDRSVPLVTGVNGTLVARRSVATWLRGLGRRGWPRLCGSPPAACSR